MNTLFVSSRKPKSIVLSITFALVCALAFIAQPAAAQHKPLPARTAAEAGAYKFPKQFQMTYQTTVQGLRASSVFEWKSDAKAYDAKLLTSALGVEFNLSSVGGLSALGVTPTRSTEKKPFRSLVALNSDPATQRVLVSNSADSMPLTSGGQDFLGMMMQLAIYVQTQARWATAGATQDFMVYTTKGLKHWRIQSQGMQTIDVGGKPTPTVYVRRVGLDGEPEHDEQQHLWLDPSRYGFPIKIRSVDGSKKVTEITMVESKEY